LRPKIRKVDVTAGNRREILQMIASDRLERSFEPTQLAGAAIQASLWLLSVAQGPFYLAQVMGFSGLPESTAAVSIVIGFSWLYLFLVFLPGATPISLQRLPRWPKIFRILACPAISTGDKVKATLTNWFSLFLILQNVGWIAWAIFAGRPLFS
jgi:hypothetical protein